MNERVSVCRDLLADYSKTPLINLPRTGPVQLGWQDCFVPLLVAYTQEDKEAKGLRKIVDPDQPRPPSYFSVLELVATERALLLTGPSGSGKTSVALDLALHFAGEQLGDPRFGLAALRRILPRNDLGLSAEEQWPLVAPVPFYLPIVDAASFPTLLERSLLRLSRSDHSSVLLILDGMERLGEGAVAVLDEMAVLLQAWPGLRLLMLGDSEICRCWSLPDGFASHRLLPLLETQRLHQAARCARLLSSAVPGTRHAAAAPVLPELFMLSLALDDALSDPDALVQAWLERDTPDPAVLIARAADAFDCWSFGRLPQGAVTSVLPRVLTALHLARSGKDAMLPLFAEAPARWLGPMTALRSVLAYPVPLAHALAGLSGPAASWGSLAAARLLDAHDAPAWSPVLPSLVRALHDPSLPALLRDEAGRHLSRHGDPRPLDALLPVAGGRLTMGSTSHANSTPVHAVNIRPFRIGRFPVTNALYARFADATGRLWRSPERDAPERLNAPATDLSWNDANAFCVWLSTIWRQEGRISTQEHVRLPSEPEWEFAARGPQDDLGDAIVYPWSGPWRPDHANSAEAGFNTSTCVGLWPLGRAPCGAEDMSGQVWEWTSTLWGEEMALPQWTYPYDATDGREAPEASPRLRRVLRGGCFSSNRLKACCTYRGSLEPDGFWRGNGFRIAVSN